MGKKAKPGTTEKTTYQMIMDGEIEPKGAQKGWKNLQPENYNFSVIDKERLTEISRKGGKAVQELHGERRTARESLERLLTLKITDEILDGADIPTEIAERFKRDNPNATLYDLIQAVAVGKALGGSLKAYELVRDTHGDKPIERVEMTENVTTDDDRALMRQIAERLNNADSIQIVKDVTEE